MKKDMRLAILKERHQHLDDVIDEMNERKHLTPSERDNLSLMKVRRLRLKDAMRTLTQDKNTFSMIPPKFELK